MRGDSYEKEWTEIIFAVVCVVIIVGLFWYTAAKKGNSAGNNDDLTEVEKVITKNLEKNYPETPREIVNFIIVLLPAFMMKSIQMTNFMSLAIRQDF